MKIVKHVSERNENWEKSLAGPALARLELRYLSGGCDGTFVPVYCNSRTVGGRRGKISEVESLGVEVDLP